MKYFEFYISESSKQFQNALANSTVESLNANKGFAIEINGRYLVSNGVTSWENRQEARHALYESPFYKLFYNKVLKELKEYTRQRTENWKYDSEYESEIRKRLREVLMNSSEPVVKFLH